MQTISQLFQQLLKDIQVELDDEFDRNFERKAFFTASWKPAKHNTIGSLMMRTGALRKSIRSVVVGTNSVKWQSSLPYAELHNNGGDITVTAKMKKYCWYRYIMATGGVQTTKKGAPRKSRSNERLSQEAAFWKAMALKKEGSVIHIPKRQFIGSHPVIDQSVKRIADKWFHNQVKVFIGNQFV